MDRNTGVQAATRSYLKLSGHCVLIFGRIAAAPPAWSSQTKSYLSYFCASSFMASIYVPPHSTIVRLSRPQALLAPGRVVVRPAAARVLAPPINTDLRVGLWVMTVSSM